MTATDYRLELQLQTSTRSMKVLLKTHAVSSVSNSLYCRKSNMKIKTEPYDASDELELKNQRFNVSDVENLESISNEPASEETIDKFDSSKQTVRIKPETKIQFEEILVKSECFDNSDSGVVDERNVEIHTTIRATGGKSDKYTACDSFADRENLQFHMRNHNLNIANQPNDESIGEDKSSFESPNSLDCDKWNMEIKTESMQDNAIEKLELKYRRLNDSSKEIIRIKPETNIEFEETVVKSECFDNSDSGVVNEYDLEDNKPFKCNICDYRAAQSKYLKQHMRKHKKDKYFKCNECNYSSSFNWCLKAHMKRHTADKLLKCKICDYTSSFKWSLKVHMLTHKGEKHYKCGMCDYAGARPDLLKSHMIKHTGCKPFKCVMCEYACARSNQLTLHMRMHTKEKPYKCTVCDFCAAKAGDLKVHMRKHTGEKPYRCTMCKHTTARSDNLKLHMKTHTGQKSESK